MISGKRIFITGGSGFIGSSLIERLIDENEIVVYDNFRLDALSSRPFAHHPNLTIIRGDVLDYPSLEKAMRGANYVVHCAAVVGIDTVILKPTETIRVNMLGAAKVLEAANKLPHLERLINFSTSEVFGQTAFQSQEGDSTTIGPVGEARWTYSVAKLAAEHLTQAYHQEFGMPTVSVRPFNVYGPGRVGEAAIMIFIRRALANENIEIHGDGNQIRAWCYIDDFIDGLLLSMTHPNAVGESFNIGYARAVITIYGLAQTVVRVLGSSSTITFVKREGQDVELRIPNVTKAKKLVGFEARVGLEEGILRTADYMIKHQKVVPDDAVVHRWKDKTERLNKAAITSEE